MVKIINIHFRTDLLIYIKNPVHWDFKTGSPTNVTNTILNKYLYISKNKYVKN